MKKHLPGIILSIICICLVPRTGLPCSSFVLDNGTPSVAGNNYDNHNGAGLLIVNKRGVAKTSMPIVQEPDAKQISWTSKFGSVTFIFVGREAAFAGINEAGLVIETMMLPESEYPQPDSRPAVGGPQWVQYQLDNCSTVDEVIASDQIMRIPQAASPYQRGHYLVTDSAGNCASIEFLGGKMVCHTGDALPVKVLTNSTYDKSIAYLGMYRGFGGILPVSLSRFLIKLGYNPLQNSLSRFVFAADIVNKFDPQTSGPAVDYAFAVLSSVAQPKITSSPTQWSIVYDITHRIVYFRTLGNDTLRHFTLSAFDFSCATPVKALDVNADLSGDITGSFVDYTEEMGRELLKKTFPTLSENEVDAIVTYPEKYTHCTE
jgi:penicillin V acylase-like amidase (Ntn superfamily)